MDREKVIREFERYVVDFVELTTTDERNHQMLEQVLALLKEQKPVKPRYTPNSIYSWECGVCAESFDRIANYCPYCGRPVKWD